MVEPDTLDAQLAVIRLFKGILRVWEDWVRRRIRKQEELAKKAIQAGDH